MIPFATPILFAAAQITIIALLGSVLIVTFSTRWPRVNRGIAGTCLIAILCLNVLAFSPWPNWRSILASEAQVSGRSDSLQERPKEHVEGEVESISSNADWLTRFQSLLENPTEPLPVDGPDNQQENITGQEPTQPSSKSPNAGISSSQAGSNSAAANLFASFNWRDSLVLLILFLTSIGLVRFAWGQFRIRQLVFRCIKCDTPAILATLRNLKQEMEITRDVELLLSSEISSAATIGWWRPSIIVPAESDHWSSEETRAILAHELAHIQHHDFFFTQLAQLCLALNFYHPLTHWIAHRYRLGSEYDADMSAANATGSATRYARLLAAIALREDQQIVGWPARMFVPTRGTFLRRIEMLHDSKQTPSFIGLGIRWLATAALVLSLFVVAGLRWNAGGDLLNAEENLQRNSELIQTDVAELAYIPSDTTLLITAQPSKLGEHKSLLSLAREGFRSSILMGLNWDESQIARYSSIGLHDRMVNPNRTGFAIVVQYVSPEARTIKSRLLRDTLTIEGKECYLIDGTALSSTQQYLYLPDEQTVIFGNREGIEAVIKSGSKLDSKLLTAKEWQSFSQQAIGVAVDMNILEGMEERPTRDPIAAVISPMFSGTDRLIGEVTWGMSPQINVHVRTDDKESSEQVVKTFEDLQTMAKAALVQMGIQRARDRAPEQKMLTTLLEVFVAASNTAKVEHVSDTEVSIKSTFALSESLSNELSTVATSTARRLQTSSQLIRLKQVGLAFHVYYDNWKSLPPRVIEKEAADGTVLKHSWRVAILPYLGLQEVYDAYRFDEPWDSEHNLELARTKMPDVYQHPNDDRDEPYTSIVVFDAEGGLFNGTSKVEFKDVHDGLSNTIAAVEAKTEIIWTQPDDLEFSADTYHPWDTWTDEYFIAVIADGSAQTLAKSLEAQTMSDLIKIQDRNVIDWGSIRAQLEASMTTADVK